MSGPDAMYGEMPGFFPGRPGGERDEPLLDMIFDRRPIPPGAPPEMHDLARMLAAAAGPAEPGELAGEAAVLAAFNRQASPASISPAALRPARRWLSGRPVRARLPLATALVAAAAGLGSVSAAYAGVLPGPIQQMAHVTMGAPPPPSGKSRALPTAASPSPSAKREPIAPRQAHSAAPPLFYGKVNHQDRRYGPSGRSPWPVATSCAPEPSPTQNQAVPAPTQSQAVPAPTQNQAKPGPSQSPPWPGSGQPSWLPQSPAAVGCLGIPTPAAAPRPSR
jgi:hypothetical protein